MGSVLDRYERDAALFLAETGILAPGKDWPMHVEPTHTEEERRTAWLAWHDVQDARAVLAQSAAPESCATCRFWLADSRSTLNPSGFCRRRAPVAGLLTAFPMTIGDEWCGEFEEVPPCAP